METGWSLSSTSRSETGRWTGGVRSRPPDGHAVGLNLTELAAKNRRLVRADRVPDANAGTPGEEVPEVRGKRPLHATQGERSRLSAARIPGSADAGADAHA